MPIEGWFLIAGGLFTVVLGFILIPIVREAMREEVPEGTPEAPPKQIK